MIRCNAFSELVGRLWMERIQRCFVIYAATSIPIFLAGFVSAAYFSPIPGRASDFGQTVFNVWDGKWYQGIVDGGYRYDPDRQSSVAFFPLFPILGAALSRWSGLRADLALLTISNVAFFLSLIVVDWYVAIRTAGDRPLWGRFVLFAVATFPMSYFFRMPYSDSLFLLVVSLTLLAMRRQAPLWIIAALIGLATAARPVGVGLLLAFAYHSWRRSPSSIGFVKWSAVLGPLSCWGIISYAIYLQLTFGNWQAFTQTQTHWRERPAVSLARRYYDLLSLEPIWSVFVPSCDCYWRTHADASILLAMQIVNPILFVGMAALAVVGAWRQWLTVEETLAASALLAIPYVTRSHEMCMDGFGRFAVVIVPSFFVAAELLVRLPRPVGVGIIALSGMLALYCTAAFVAGYAFF